MRCSRACTVGLLLAALMTACTTAPRTAGARIDLRNDAEAALSVFRAAQPALMKEFMQASVGYVVFPTVAKGGLIVGGAHGRGVLYERDRPVGYADLTQGTIGLQIGGQGYRELIFFETEEALRDFKAGKIAFSAQASAVVVEAGAATTADYEQGVAIFTMPKGGAMLEASVGGQGFSYEPL